MKGVHSLSTKLVLIMLLPLALLLFGATWMESRTASRAMIQTGETAALNLANTVKEELQGVLRSTKTGVGALALGLERLPAISGNEAGEVISQFVNDYPLVFGSTLAFEIDETKGFEPLAPYAVRDDAQVRIQSLARDDYRYWEWDWFNGPMLSGEPEWSKPYLDEGGGNVRMVTYSQPLQINNRRAVLTADIELGFLTEIASSNLLGRPGAVLIFDQEGRLVAHPRDEWLLQRTLTDIAREQNIAKLDLVASSNRRGEQTWLRPEDGVHEGLIGGDASQAGRVLLLPLKEAGWGIGVYFSDRDFLAPVEHATDTRRIFALATLLLVAFLLALVTYRALKPLGELANRTRAIAQGKFNGHTPGLKRKDEIGRLSRAFNLMQDQLEQYVGDLTRATSESQRIQTELDTARRIHQALLPNPQPDFGSAGVELQAYQQQALTVGGDLYNFELQKDGKLFFVIGDVSQSGVPAALFMSRADALLRLTAKTGAEPSQLLETVNQALCEDNALHLFSTLLAGRLSLSDGTLQLASAGHDAPLRIDANGNISSIEVERGSSAGVNENSNYVTTTTTLNAGDALLCYSSGVTNAKHPERGLFTRKNLQDELRTASDNHPGSLITAVTQALSHFTDDAAPSEDATVLALRLKSTPG